MSIIPLRRPTPAVLDRDFWHGTTRGALTKILREGLRPECCETGHTCLTTRPEIALFFARLHTLYGDTDPDAAPVLIRIDGRRLDPSAVVPETGCVRLSPYGNHLPERAPSRLDPVKDDWAGLLARVDCIGTRETLPVSADMIAADGAPLPFPDKARLLEEYRTGAPVEPEIPAFLAELEAPSMRAA